MGVSLTKPKKYEQDFRGKSSGKLTVIDQELRTVKTRKYLSLKCVCVCGTKKTAMMREFEKCLFENCITCSHLELVGKKFDNWTVEFIVGKAMTNSSARYLCRCDCGRTRERDKCVIITKNCKNCGICEIIGERFGRWFVEDYEHSENNNRYYKCVCDCGRTRIVLSTNLKKGITNSCGKCNYEDLTNEHFGWWYVEGLSHKKQKPDKKSTIYWKCKCKCGNNGIVQSGSLKNGASKSCGCYLIHLHKTNPKYDLSGKQFGNWYVIRKAEKYDVKNGCRWECVCRCGRIKNVLTGSLKCSNEESCCSVCKRKQLEAERLAKYKDPYFIDRDGRRNRPRHWRMSILKRDNFRYKICGDRKRIQAHHISAWKHDIDNRYNLDNGICLCYKCHRNYHSVCGSGKNTKIEFELYFAFHRMIPCLPYYPEITNDSN